MPRLNVWHEISSFECQVIVLEKIKIKIQVDWWVVHRIENKSKLRSEFFFLKKKKFENA
jgi:hypothetical protein